MNDSFTGLDEFYSKAFYVWNIALGIFCSILDHKIVKYLILYHL